MPNPFINSIASWFLKKRLHQIELFVKYPNEVQNDVLMNLINTAKDTLIGKEYDYNSIKNYREFTERVPVFKYEDFSEKINRARKGEQNIFWPTKIKWFAKSSGTTNSKSKFIPVSQESLEECHYDAGKDLLCIYLNNNEDSMLFAGKSLRLGGSKSPYEKNGTYYGDLSAILIENMPLWFEFSSTPSTKTTLIDDWEIKIKEIIKETIPENVTSLAGVPSWMLVLLNRTSIPLKNSTGINKIKSPKKKSIRVQNNPWPFQVIIFLSTLPITSNNKYKEYPETPAPNENKYNPNILKKFFDSSLKLILLLLIF